MRKVGEEGGSGGLGRGGRKREAVIREEVKEGEGGGEGVWRPRPVGMSADEKKRDLQERMSGIKAVKERVKEERRRSEEKEEEEGNRAGEDREMEGHEDRVFREIDERQRFLDAMTAQGRGGQYEPAIRAEIAQLMRELR